MPQGFADSGFQTQLSETFNKQAQKGDSLLEAYLDANGRLAFRFVDSSGNIIGQPRVTTPGFVPPSLGTGTTSFPSPSPSPSPSTTSGGFSATASGNLISDLQGGADAGGGGGFTSPTDQLDQVGFSARPPGPPSETTTNVRRVVSVVPGIGTALGLATQVQKRRASVVPVGLQTLREAMADESSLNRGLAPLGSLSGLDAAVVGNRASVDSLDSTSSRGTTIGGHVGARGTTSTSGLGEPGVSLGGSAGDFEGVSSLRGLPDPRGFAESLSGPSSESESGVGAGGGRGGGPGGRF